MHQKATKRLRKTFAIILAMNLLFANTTFAQEPTEQVSDLSAETVATTSDAQYDSSDIIEEGLLDDLLEEDLASYHIDSSGEYADYMNSSYPDDMPKAVIVIPASKPKDAQYAAKLIQRYVAAEDGYTPSIITDATSKGSKGFEISVGATNRPHGTAKYTSAESYSIKSFSGGISITGVGELGLLHGAMRFLEACGGYYYMSWNDLYVTNQTHFKYDVTNGISIDYERAFIFTDIDIAYWCLNPAHDSTDPNRDKVGTAGYEPSYTGRLFSLAFGYNGFYSDSYGLPETEPGYKSLYLSALDETYTEPDAVVGLPAGQAHTLLAEFAPASKYYTSHPEWYCANKVSECLDNPGYKTDAQKTRSSTQLCYYKAANDPTLYNIILQHCYDILEKSYDPNASMQIISLTKNDTADMCYCDYCITERLQYNDPTEGANESYELLALCNKISKDIHKNGAYDNVYIDTLAYTHSLNAPVGMTADEHVIIRFAPINRCYGHTLDCKRSECLRNVDYYPELKKWLQIADHVWIWDYNANFRTTIGPYANVSVMQSDIKLYYKLGVEGVYLQSNDIHQDSNTEFGDIRNYVLSRMLQDPTRDYEAELTFFTDAYYGESGKYVREYMKLMEKQMANHHMIAETRDYLANFSSYLYDIYADEGKWSDNTHRMPDSDIAACETLWTKINATSANASDKIQTRLKKLEISWRLVKSTLMACEFSNPATYKAQNEKLIADIDAVGVHTFAIIMGIKMNQCIYTSRKPDLWAFKPATLSTVDFSANLANFALKTSMTEKQVSALLQQEGLVLSNSSDTFLIDYASCGLSYKYGSNFIDVSKNTSNVTPDRSYYARVVLSVAGRSYDWASKSEQSPSLAVKVNGQTLTGATLQYDSTTNEYSIYVPYGVTVDTHTHSMTAVARKDATETTAGNYAYWVCANEPGVYYKDADGSSKFSSKEATIIPAKGYADGWQIIDDKRYYYSDGNPATGWIKVASVWYYMDASGIMQTGWQKLSNKWYYFETSGAMVTAWKLISGKWYYFNSGGDMVTGWKQISSKWYYFNSNGDMVIGWRLISGKWYYFNSNGDMVIGWKQISSKWYYFNSNGDMVIGWKQISGKWYYFNSNGVMVTGTQTIGGKVYKFDSSGKWIP